MSSLLRIKINRKVVCVTLCGASFEVVKTLHIAFFLSSGAACTGYNTFPYTILTADMEEAELYEINCDEPSFPDNSALASAPSGIASLVIVLIAIINNIAVQL